MLTELLPSHLPEDGGSSSLILQGGIPEQDHQVDNLLVCHDWDNTLRWKPGERLHHLFEQRVDQFLAHNDVEHLAVDSSEGTWTYAALDQQANQVARYLIRQGLGAGDIVGLLFDKSVYSYVSMLAVLKIHAAYVPLDPAFPEERIAYIAADAGFSSVLTLMQYQPLILGTRLSALCLDDPSKGMDQLATSRLTCGEVRPPVNELCYIIYTSGSTGQPKGVPIDQASICNFVRVAGEVYGYQSSDRVYQGLTIAFDFAVEEIWVPLFVGATLLPNQTGSSLLGSELAEFLQKHRITAMCCVPTLLGSLDETLPDLRLLIVSGEACPQDLITRWYRPERTIINAYGPTETTVTATISWPKPGEPVTIGKPLPTYSVVILEPGTEKVLPFGEEGEIAIAGVGVARGYLNREAQTKKSFIKDFLHIEKNPSGLIYRSGDLGCINEKGDIEYRGRIDQQVKIRGYRIELAEIESVILTIPDIHQAVVNVFEPVPGVKELVAYYTTKNGQEAALEQGLIQTLRAALPNYMVPVYYQWLESLPMMASDKVDRKALPTPSARRMSTHSEEWVEPGSSTEKIIAEKLAELLNLERVSVRDDFFLHLGVSSLLMARFCAVLRRCLPGIGISMRDVYACSTVETLATCLDSRSVTQDVEPSVDEYHMPGLIEYWCCGILQLFSYFIFSVLALGVLGKAFPWILSATGPLELYSRFSGFLAVLFFAWTGLVIAAKWILIGKWKAEKIPIWSLKYFRFWLLKKIILSSPMALFKGYPIYHVYLRLMGARIGKNVVMECQSAPLCADLLSIGDNTVLRHDSLIIPYKARSNYIYTGPVTLGKNVVVGEGSVIDINTEMKDGAQLGHASCLLDGQVIAEGLRYHGNPAEETTTDFRCHDHKPVSRGRKIAYSLGQLVARFYGFPSLIFCLVYYLATSMRTPEYGVFTSAWVFHVLMVASIVFMGFLLLNLISVAVIPRLLNRFLVEGRVYVLYGVHFHLFKIIQKLSNASQFHLLLGDSSFIVHYMKWVGYQLRNVIQTGSNFGLEHKHDNPLLCQLGSGTMISDGLSILNVHESSTSFRLAQTSIGEHNFIGNNVYYPPEGKTGRNCLIATKAMVPVDGVCRENTGLLGSPCFEIPRVLQEDQSMAALSQSSLRSGGLQQKNHHNLITIMMYLGSRFIYLCSAFLLGFYLAQSDSLSMWQWIFYVNLFLVFSIGYFLLLERGAYAFGKMKALNVSIYDEEYWRVERVWKFSETFLRQLWSGTPFRSMINRLLGIKVGKMVFDDGLYVSEKTMVEIGDYCNFNTHCVLQSHSLEEGVYKSDFISVGHRCTIEAQAFVHYGVTLKNDVRINADAFVMKGECLEDQTVWQGNPAQQISTRKKDNLNGESGIGGTGFMA